MILFMLRSAFVSLKLISCKNNIAVYHQIYYHRRISSQDFSKQKIFISFLVLFRFTLTLKTTIVKLRGIWNRCKRSCDCGRFLPSVLTTKGWRTGVFTDMRPVLWACLGFNMCRHSKTFLQVCMSITTPYTYLPLHH